MRFYIPTDASSINVFACTAYGTCVLPHSIQNPPTPLQHKPINSLLVRNTTGRSWLSPCFFLFPFCHYFWRIGNEAQRPNGKLWGHGSSPFISPPDRLIALASLSDSHFSQMGKHVLLSPPWNGDISVLKHCCWDARLQGPLPLHGWHFLQTLPPTPRPHNHPFIPPLAPSSPYTHTHKHTHTPCWKVFSFTTHIHSHTLQNLLSCIL